MIKDWLYDLYYDYIRPKTIKRKIVFFWQRLYRGFDDSDTWSLDYTLYKWLLPRLKYFREKTNCWNDQKYKTFKDWQDTLDKRIEQLEYIIKHFNDYEFSNYKETKEFNEWLSKDINELWW